MFKNKFYIISCFVAISALILSACASATPTAAPATAMPAATATMAPGSKYRRKNRHPAS